MSTKDDLLKPRWICIARYPDSPVGIGQIISGETFNIPSGTKFHCKDYPAIFKPLAWYEEREASEWPEYIKGLNTVKKLLKVEDHGGEFLSILCEGETVWGTIWMYQPATEAEYLNHQKQTS